MSDPKKSHLEQLRDALNRGAIDEDTYRAAVMALGDAHGSVAPAARAKVSAETGGVSAGDDSVAVGGSVSGHVIVAREGARIVIGEQPIAMTAVDRESALGRYLSHVISRTRYLQLQGIRSGGKLVNIELEHIYINLRATGTATSRGEEFAAEETDVEPGALLRHVGGRLSEMLVNLL
jgi:hypothetical protein